MSEGSRISFQGSSAAETEEFVQAVRRKGLAEQKQFDDRWMAAYAAAQMGGQALRWHMGLPRDIKSDWGKLEMALLDRFAPDQSPATPNNNPIVPNGAPAQPTLRTGRIRIKEIVSGRLVGYISKSIANDGYLGSGIETTTLVEDALLVEFTPSSSLVTFALVDKSQFHRLALRLYGESLELHPSYTTMLSLVCFAPGPKPGSIRYSSRVYMGQVAHVQHEVWKVDVNGSITLVWPSSPQVGIGADIPKPPCLTSLWFQSNIHNVMGSIHVKLEFEHA